MATWRCEGKPGADEAHLQNTSAPAELFGDTGASDTVGVIEAADDGAVRCQRGPRPGRRDAPVQRDDVC